MICQAHVVDGYKLGHIDQYVENMGIPVITIKNTLPEFYALTNYVETYLSFSVWHMINSASLGREYFKTSK